MGAVVVANSASTRPAALRDLAATWKLRRNALEHDEASKLHLVSIEDMPQIKNWQFTDFK